MNKCLFKKFSKSNSNINELFLKEINNKIINYIKFTRNLQLKVTNFKTPEDLKKIIDFDIKNTYLEDNELLNIVDNVLKYSVNTSHPHFYNTLFGGIDEYSLSADFITSTLNGTMYSFEMAPVFTLMEQSIYNKLSYFLKWDNLDGIFCPGGSIANLYGLLLARHKLFPEIKNRGIQQLPQFVIFTSEVGHYSIDKASIVLGIGKDNVIKIQTDLKGKMDTTDLEKNIIETLRNGKIPLAVNATIGTTVFGSVDPISNIAEICKKYNVWLHIDACFGGSLILNKYVNCECDSIAFDPHKVLTVPLQCSIFMTKHKLLLKECNSTNADYLFMKDKVFYDASIDSGDGSIQCGRHIDVFKFWLYLKAKGFDKIIDEINESIDNAKYMAKKIQKHKNFELILEPEFLNVCFYYFPNRFLDRSKDEKFWEDYNKIPPIIKSEMIKEGTMMLAYQKQSQKIRNLNNFFRPVLTIDKTKDDIDFIIYEINRIGYNL